MAGSLSDRDMGKKMISSLLNALDKALDCVSNLKHKDAEYHKNIKIIRDLIKEDEVNFEKAGEDGKPISHKVSLYQPIDQYEFVRELNKVGIPYAYCAVDSKRAQTFYIAVPSEKDEQIRGIEKRIAAKHCRGEYTIDQLNGLHEKSPYNKELDPRTYDHAVTLSKEEMFLLRRDMLQDFVSSKCEFDVVKYGKDPKIRVQDLKDIQEQYNVRFASEYRNGEYTVCFQKEHAAEIMAKIIKVKALAAEKQVADYTHQLQGTMRDAVETQKEGQLFVFGSKDDDTKGSPTHYRYMIDETGLHEWRNDAWHVEAYRSDSKFNAAVKTAFLELERDGTIAYQRMQMTKEELAAKMPLGMGREEILSKASIARTEALNNRPQEADAIINQIMQTRLEAGAVNKDFETAAFCSLTEQYVSGLIDRAEANKITEDEVRSMILREQDCIRRLKAMIESGTLTNDQVQSYQTLIHECYREIQTYQYSESEVSTDVSDTHDISVSHTRDEHEDHFVR